MKKQIIFLRILVVCLAVAAIVVLYRKNFSPSPEKITKVKLDQMFHEREENSVKNKTDMAALFMSKIQETQLACALEDPKDHQDKIFENIGEGLQKLDYKVSKISSSSVEAKVSVSINYFNLQEITQNAQKKLQNYLQANNSLSTKEMIAKMYEMIANEFKKGPSDNNKTKVVVLLHKKNHKWEMDRAFEAEILDAILQQ